MALALRYLGHREGASLGYFTGAVVTLRAGQQFPIPDEGIVLGRSASADLRVASPPRDDAEPARRAFGQRRRDPSDLEEPAYL